MKKTLIFLLLISGLSCSVSDDTPRSYTEFLPIESVSMPDAFIKNQTYTIYLTYNKPTSCHLFKDIYYVVNANQSTVAIVSDVYPASSDCQETITEEETSFNFRPTELGSYVFKFWQGINTESATNEDIYLTIEVSVTE